MIVVSVLLITAALLLFIVHLRYPLFFFHVGPQMWSVGFGRLAHRKQCIEPDHILDYKKVKEMSGADFIADPFLIKETGGKTLD